MAPQCDRPYRQFNFLVVLTDGNTDGPHAGFQEVSGLSADADIAEYRGVNDPVSAMRKIPGLVKVPDITLKRGVIRSLELHNWINGVRNGKEGALRTVVIQLQDEARNKVVMEWKLFGAWPVKCAYASLGSSGTDVAIEELVLAFEGIEGV